jgi:hypothetical protein
LPLRLVSQVRARPFSMTCQRAFTICESDFAAPPRVAGETENDFAAPPRVAGETESDFAAPLALSPFLCNPNEGMPQPAQCCAKSIN